VDVEHAADLYAQGRTLRQIGAEVGVTATTVGEVPTLGRWRQVLADALDEACDWCSGGGRRSSRSSAHPG
jgi:hypothetical protein